MLYQLLFILIIGSAFAADDDDSFSIGLGVLSPSYKQRVGKENVQVTFDQKENGQFSYSISDPKLGSNSYLSFGGASAANNNNNNAAAPQQAYQAPAQQAYQAPAPQQAYQAPSYAAPQQGYQAPAQQAYQAPSYAAPQPSYQAPAQQAYQAPSYAAPQQAAREPSAGFMPAGFSYHATEGQAYLRQGGELRKPDPSPNQIMPAGFSYHATEGQSFLRGSEARKPEGQGLPAGFSYHAMEGQSFLRQGDSPNFMIGTDRQQQGSSARGPAENSFYTNFQQGGQGLANGLVGYGQGGPSRGSLPIGGYAGAQHSGTFKEHGGHE